MIECSCGRKRASIKYELESHDGFFDCVMNVIYEKCPCGKFILELERTNKEGRQKPKRFYGKEAYEIHDKLEKSILHKIGSSNVVCGRFYLNYGEYGKKKRCYSNLSTLKMGRLDNTIGFQKEGLLKAG
ncbi:MAG: hypothetical protein WCY19_05070 [Candidatus Gastranaerophilaceae bacterium]